MFDCTRDMKKLLLTASLIASMLPASLSVGGSELSGTLVVLNKAGATASLIDLSDCSVRATVPTDEALHETAVSPDGSHALVGNYGNRSVPGSILTVIDIVRARTIKTINLGEYRRPHGLLSTPDGRRALVTAGRESDGMAYSPFEVGKR